MATFGEAVVPASRAGGSDESEGSEGEDEDDAVDDEDEEEDETRLPFDLISSAQAGPSKAKVTPPTKAASRPKAKSAAASASSSRRPPETVVFEETGGRGRSAVEDEGVASDSKKKWRDFMVSASSSEARHLPHR